MNIYIYIWFMIYMQFVYRFFIHIPYQYIWYWGIQTVYYTGYFCRYSGSLVISWIMCQFWDNLMKVKCQWLQKSVESCSRRPATYTAAFDPATMVVRYDMCRVWHGMTQMVHDTPDPLAKLDWVDRHRPLLSTWPVNVPMRQLPRPSLWII